MYHPLTFLTIVIWILSLGDMTDDTSVNPIVDVEVEPVRRSARQRKQTQFYGNPWLYRIACNLTPWGLTDLLQHSLTDMK